MTNEEIKRLVDEFVKTNDYDVFELVSVQKPKGAEEAITNFVRSLVAQAYDEAAQIAESYEPPDGVWPSDDVPHINLAATFRAMKNSLVAPSS